MSNLNASTRDTAVKIIHVCVHFAKANRMGFRMVGKHPTKN